LNFLDFDLADLAVDSIEMVDMVKKSDVYPVLRFRVKLVAMGG
jgi:hypothetical protein